MNARAIHACGRRFRVRLVPLPAGVPAIRMGGGQVLVRHMPGDPCARTVRRVLHVLAVFRRPTQTTQAVGGAR